MQFVVQPGDLSRAQARVPGASLAFFPSSCIFAASRQHLIYMSGALLSFLVLQAERRARFFGRYGERYDRRLFADVEAIQRLYLDLVSSSFIFSDPLTARRIESIRVNMIRSGANRYNSFP